MTRFKLKPNLVCSKIQTADWRAKQVWYQGGKHNECEKYQRSIVELITTQPCLKTQVRIHTSLHIMKKCIRPMSASDGFEWTENFDGVLKYNKAQIFVNLKFVCSAGGAQTRTLREVYHFVRAQANYISTSGCRNTYFVNILEGDACAAVQDKYKYILANNMSNTNSNIFVGDMAAFSAFWRKKFI